MKRNVFIRSGYFILLASFFVVLLFSISEVYLLNTFNGRIKTVYRNSINYSSNYWANQFYVINSELQSMIDKNNQTDFNLLCQHPEAREEEAEAWRNSLLHDLNNMSTINNGQFVFFAYIPSRDLLLSTIYNVNNWEQQVNEDLIQILKQASSKNTAYWEEATLGGNLYFLHLYCCNGGYSGVYISCNNVLKDIMPGEEGSNACILNMDGSLFYGKGMSGENGYFSYARPIRMINKKIAIEIPYQHFVSSGSYIFIVLVIATIAAFLLVFLAVLFQRRTVFHPITKLEEAMEAFSGGDTSVRLPTRMDSREIQLLYRTFNHMADQIVDLKYNVYEAELEKQKTYNQFLRVQVQPHFYTNILNLIYALAGTKDFSTIQELSRYMAAYFRYLLSLKGDYVKLSDELSCIDQYVKVQKIRYQGNFEINIDCQVNANEEMIPPLLLQTFIENSIRHNIMLVPELSINVNISSEQDDNGQDLLAIVIGDNGVGFDGNILERLNSGESIEEEGRHIGINNVIHRMQVLFGDQAKIEIRNKDKGAEITIRVPVHREENEDGQCIDC